MNKYLAHLLSLFVLFFAVTASAQDVVINEIFAQGKGKRPDWIELYNPGKKTCDLGGFTLSDNRKKPSKWTIPENTVIRPGSFVLFFADKKNFENHTNFKLDAGGEFVGLYDPTGNCIDSITFNKFTTAGSLGRYPDGAKQLTFFTAPTMGGPNVTSAPSSMFTDPQPGPAPEVSPQGGHYNRPQQVIIRASVPGTRIYYTTDGSLPTLQSSQYKEPLTISSTTVLRCISVDAENRSSAVVTQTFLLNEYSALPTISLVTDPRNLWDEETGIYVKGKRWKRRNFNKALYNWKQSWKRPCNFEFFDKTSAPRINTLCTMKIFGGVSRNMAQKSFSLQVVDPATDSFAYAFFPQKNIPEFKSLLLRNSGDDWKQTMFRDTLMHALVHKRMDMDIQAWAPAIVFLNGTYWGIYNMREKLDPWYVTNNHGVAPENMDMIKCYTDIKAGSDDAYKALISFIRSHDLTDIQHYTTFENQIDINEFINYQLSQIFYDNCDWPDNNIAWWREHKDDAKWRWILYDTDEGFQLLGKNKSCSRNTLRVATKGNNGNAVLFNALLRNEQFKNRFLQIFAAHMNTTFRSERVVNFINRLHDVIRPEMPRHINRWGAIASMDEWENNVDELRRFARERSAHVYKHLMNKFHLDGTVELILDVNDPNKGHVRMDTVDIPTKTSSGTYFKNVPMDLHAVAASDHHFVRWEGLTNSTSEHMTFTPKQSGTIRAVFQ